MAKIMRQTSIKKFTASLLISSMLLSFGACSQNSKYSLDKIKLSGTERSWACPDEKYKTLLESYDGYTVTGAIAVATDAVHRTKRKGQKSNLEDRNIQGLCWSLTTMAKCTGITTQENWMTISCA